MLHVRRTTALAAALVGFALPVAVPSPASAAGYGSVRVTVCGSTSTGYIACLTGTALNTNTWHRWAGGTRCWSTGCGSYEALDEYLPPLTGWFSRVFEIPGNAFDVCAELRDNGSLVAYDFGL